MRELIKHAAVKGSGGMIFLGKSHADCFHQASHAGIRLSGRAQDQGFFTSKGRFVTRPEAYEIAIVAGQIEGERPAPVLFSEMLWSPRDGGKFKYDSIQGYYL